MGGHSNHANITEATALRSKTNMDQKSETTHKWVKNLSNPAIEHACSKLDQGEAEELRVEIKKVPKKALWPLANMTKEEYKAIHELKNDHSRMVFTADKGVTWVVIDKADYITKAEDLLNKPTYRKIPEDSTNRQKTTLINLLKTSRQKRAYQKKHTKGCTPQGKDHPNSMGYLRSTNQVYPWGP